MEQTFLKPDKFIAVDMQFHGRDQHPTKTLEATIKKAAGKGSPIIRVYGKPVLLVDMDTHLVYLKYKFSPEITEKFIDGTLTIPPGMVPFIDKETQERMKAKEKRRLKNETRVWHKHK